MLHGTWRWCVVGDRRRRTGMTRRSFSIAYKHTYTSTTTCLHHVYHSLFMWLLTQLRWRRPRHATPRRAAGCGGTRAAAASPTAESGKLHTLVVPSFIDVFWQQFPDWMPPPYNRWLNVPVCNRPVGAGGAPSYPKCPHILADQLILSQPVGQTIPSTLLLAPLDFQTFLQPW